MNIILTKDSRKFIEKLGEKNARQIAIKIKELSSFGHLNDSKPLKGSKENYYRTDVGEFRIIYRHQEEDLEILLVGKRNDNEVYNLFKRKTK